jgi:vancomycin aglycone glucosyltransferase
VRLVIVVSGSRGDVQPMLAIALGLMAAGQDVVVCSSPDNERAARECGCVFESIGEPLRDNPSFGSWGFTGFNRFIRRQIDLQIRGLPRLMEGCDLVLASGLAFGARPVAERLGIPYRYVAFTPASFLGTTRDPMWVRVVRGAADGFAELAYGSALNRGRAALGLAPVRRVMRQLMGATPIAATDRDLDVLPQGVRLRSRQTGYPLLAPRGDLSETLRRFLATGPPPVYAGFGSMPVDNPRRMAAVLVDAAERAGQRLVVSRGWAKLPDVPCGDGCLFVDDEPHSLLFSKVGAVLHHGGAGTVATAARAGVPQILLPVAADQFLWRSRVVKLGLGPATPMLRFATARSIARAMTMALGDPLYQENAAAMAARLRAAPDGVTTTVAEITT